MDKQFYVAKKQGFYDIKLLVNGIELEPKFLNHLINNISKFIEDEAKSVLDKKLCLIKEKAEILEGMVNQACLSIRNDMEK